MVKHKVLNPVLWMTIFLVFAGTVGISMAAEYEKVPILMIHGMGGNSMSWNSTKAYLRQHGYDDKLFYTIDMTDNMSLCADSHVPQISAKIEEIVSKTGFNRIDVIGHSRGGLNLYNYMRFDNGPSRIRNWISLGGSNNMACFGLYGSPPSDPTPGANTGYTSIYSLADELVTPQMAIIQGARNISLENASHFTLPMNDEVLPLILDALQGSGFNDGVAVTNPKSPSPPTGLRVISSINP